MILVSKSGSGKYFDFTKKEKNQLENIHILISRIFFFFRFSVFEIEVNGFYGEECLSTIVIYDGFDESAEELLRQCGTGTCCNI